MTFTAAIGLRVSEKSLSLYIAGLAELSIQEAPFAICGNLVATRCYPVGDISSICLSPDKYLNQAKESVADGD